MWLVSCVVAPVQLLFLNLDETSVSYTFHQAKGLYHRRLKRQGRAHTQIRKSDLRGAVTHVAAICERSEVQPRLPQVIIGNKHRFMFVRLHLPMCTCSDASLVGTIRYVCV